MPMASTSTCSLARKSIKSGVIIGESRVLAVVMPTEKAKSPWQRKVIRLLETPPGLQPTRMRPTVSSGLRLSALETVKAIKGIRVNCATVPTRMS